MTKNNLWESKTRWAAASNERRAMSGSDRKRAIYQKKYQELLRRYRLAKFHIRKMSEGINKMTEIGKITKGDMKPYLIRREDAEVILFGKEREAKQR